MIPNEFNLQRKKNILLYAKILHHLQNNLPVVTEQNSNGETVQVFLKLTKGNKQDLSLIHI